jgi:hypothetical protein
MKPAAATDAAVDFRADRVEVDDGGFRWRVVRQRHPGGRVGA